MSEPTATEQSDQASAGRSEAACGKDAPQPSGADISLSQIALAAAAAFSTYFCMYAFRKPFTAATWDGQRLFGLELKEVLVVAQLCGYMTSKFAGIRILAELPPHRRALAICGLIGLAELALIGFAVAPPALRPALLFLNGLPLGMVFGIVLSFLEGRLQTEAMAAVLCSSFIISSGVVKSVGSWLVEQQQMSEFTMPMTVGGIFILPLLISVFLLQRTPPPGNTDLHQRQQRRPINRAERKALWLSCWPGLSCLVAIYVALTILRTIRDDFGVEIWQEMGVSEQPSVFTYSEMLVAFLACLLNGFAVAVRGSLMALRVTFVLMAAALTAVALSPVLYDAGLLSPFGFMVTCGAGLYAPYVAFHTTVFERLIAISRHPGNVVFLMYVADASGYLGYAVVLGGKALISADTQILPLFQWSLTGISVAATAGLLLAWIFIRRLADDSSAATVNAAVQKAGS